MHLFRLDASIIPGTSTSSELAGTAEAAWAAAHPEGTVTRRNLGTDPLPGDAWTHATLGAFTPEDQRSAEQRAAVALGAELAEELRSADAAIIAVPLYNWGVSQHFKTWVDLVIAGAGPTDELLKDKPVVLATSLGGGFAPGTPREGWDHSTPYLERILRDVWGADLTTVRRELTLAQVNPAMESLRGLAAEYHTQALEAADAAGKALVRG
ncbi:MULTISPECIES: NAD(P)H-dependent oxidoreductase [Kitasatospora]|uniref:Putative FMN-dependent NADH-azoreductase n=1 Tax=Kitasatospora setae (strain ATCC 33774 / DSM 43861 / JCM 3304 / KCC A-0304 / NBRC 14216 / KM-6054) TaxID=452652 RepID=E4N952_KITSK|nr:MULTISPECIES: NAD(P)H-dependent oxidoreductase [Kitasatospora]BAJ27733.1 putative FMN-dependent NADH-azoreductase [Kitasatospora setae KM-6054]